MIAPGRHANPPAIVIGLDCMTGLQTARILARHQVPVIGVAADRNHYGCRTRVCREILHADTAGDGLIHILHKLAARSGQTDDAQKPILFPCTDLSVLAISRNRQSLEPFFHIMLPAPEVVEMLMDKNRFMEFAERNGLPVPKTLRLHNRQDALAAAAALNYPCVLKPPVKTPEWQRHTTIKAFRVESADEFLSQYDRCSAWSDVLLVQEWIEGSESSLYSCNCYFGRSGEPLATFIARKLRQWPPGTGTSCLGEECRNDVVLDESLKLFRSVHYRGLGYLEMKRDERTGRHYIIEPNIGRPTGRSAIAEAGGVELLYTMYCDALGWSLPPERQQQYTGVKWIDWRRDLQSAWYYWRRGELTLRQWFDSLRGRKFSAVFSRTDPGPGWGDVTRAVRLAIAGLARRCVASLSRVAARATNASVDSRRSRKRTTCDHAPAPVLRAAEPQPNSTDTATLTDSFNGKPEAYAGGISERTTEARTPAACG
jgi:predicted ATP-grasp superfamily ATP-dependent carboligase